MSSKRNIATISIIGVGVLLISFFGMRAFHVYNKIRGGGFGLHKPPPAMETDVELIRDWMTIPYIAKTYGAPDRMLFRELNVPENDNRDKSLKQLNDEYYPNEPGIILKKVKAAILDHRPPAP